ncbi:uncharacterized protein LOC129900672 [Solanum dulcamara]|uniref:uncharacterized protein LOC129900672 n=1 Tax=Solanum dulcamara TaxID=45834 RepID=UPI0024865526|nr:uncharacterized protein LOC129900672 [Solanum dulcamara]
MSLPNKFPYFYVLLCSECKHLVRMKRKKIIQYINCKFRKMLIPRCEFEVEITDANGTITTTVSENLAERMLSMTAKQIYETTAIKKQLMPFEHIREELLQKSFKIHLQKSLLWTPDRTPGSLVVLSYSQKQTTFDLPQVSTPINIRERSKKKR